MAVQSGLFIRYNSPIVTLGPRIKRCGNTMRHGIGVRSGHFIVNSKRIIRSHTASSVLVRSGCVERLNSYSGMRPCFLMSRDYGGIIVHGGHYKQ